MTEAFQPRRLSPPDISAWGLAKLSAPMFVANLAVMGNVTIDTIMAGRLGAENLAAIALAGASTACVTMLLVGVLQGLAPICGHHFGARKLERIGFEINQALYVAIILACLGIPVLGYTDFWMQLGEVRGNVARMAAQYLLFSCAGIPAVLAGRIFLSVFSAVNKPQITMWVSLGALACKAPLNCVFMYGLLGFPELNGAGAGVSNAVIAWGSTAAYAAVFLTMQYFRPMLPAAWYRPSLSAIFVQLRLGIPIGISVFFEVSSFTLMAVFVSRLGAVPVSAHQIVSNITSTLFMIPLSIGIAANVLVAQCLGAGFPRSAEEIARRSLRIALIIAATACALLYFAQDPIIRIYTSQDDVAAIAGSLIICGIIYHTFDAAQSVSSFILRGYRITWVPMFVTAIALWCLGLMGGYCLCFCETPLGPPMGTIGFWIACAAGLIVSGIFLTSYALLHARKAAAAA